MVDHHFSGVWRSHYVYHSTGRKSDFEDEHYVTAHQRGNQLVFQSLPVVNDSYLIVRLSISDILATGSWEETTATNSYYKGRTYMGVLQLVIADDGKSMKGKWVGFGAQKEINIGPWEFTYVGPKLPKSVNQAGPEKEVKQKITRQVHHDE